MGVPVEKVNPPGSSSSCELTAEQIGRLSGATPGQTEFDPDALRQGSQVTLFRWAQSAEPGVSTADRDDAMLDQLEKEHAKTQAKAAAAGNN